jgi:ectoine hydroxylase-related dioxygenase (phytanoyl-CoA dioxygenase family)
VEQGLAVRWEEICSTPPLAIDRSGRDRWDELGYLAFPALLGDDRLRPLQGALAEIIEASRSLSESSLMIDLDAGHRAESPRLRRAALIDDVDEVFWDFCRDSVLVDIAADVLGPNVRFRDAFANLKWSGGGAAVDWHQDIAFYPHTNTGTIQFIVALDDLTPERGPLTVVPGSHKGPMYSHYGGDGSWVGAIGLDQLDAAELDSSVQITGPAGSVSVHHALTLHYSAPNHSDTNRPALVITYAAADAIPYTVPPYRSSHYGELVRGVEPGIAHHEEMTMILPPDWSHGYTSIFRHQDARSASEPTPEDS